MQTTDDLKRELLNKVRLLGSNQKAEKKQSMLSLLKLISQIACEEKIKFMLENQVASEESKQFDPYYKLKSEFATLKILELLKSKLSAKSVDAKILTEATNDFGKYDIVIMQKQPSKDDISSTKKVRIEVKASTGLDFEQLDRYLWDSSPLILARVITGHVAKLNPTTLRSYTSFSLTELNAKADRLISNNRQKIPGPECYSCGDLSCEFCKRIGTQKNSGIISVSTSDFNTDLNLFFRNLCTVAERTATLALEEFNE